MHRYLACFLLFSAGAFGQINSAGRVFSPSNQPINIGVQPLESEFPNAAAGTSTGSLVKLIDTAGTMQITKTAITDTNNAYGCVQSGAGASGTAQVAFAGTASCLFDNVTITDGDFVVVSVNTVGTLSDSGSGTSAPTGVLNMGKAKGTHAPCGAAPCGPYTVILQTPDALGAAGTGIIATPNVQQTVQPSTDVTGLVIKQSNTTNTADIFNVQDKSANKVVQADSAQNVEVLNNLKVGGPRPYIDITAPPYNAPFTTGATAPTLDACAAIRSAVAALPTSGGEILFPVGRYGCSTAATDSQGASVGVDLGQKSSVRLQCAANSAEGQDPNGAAGRGCSLELISGIPAGTIAIQTGIYVGTGGSYAGPKIEGLTIIDATTTAGAGIAVKDTSDSVLNSIDTEGFGYAGLSAPAGPTVTATAGGSLGATVTVFVKVAHRTGWGISLPSAEASATTDGTCPGSGNCTITVTHPTNPSAPAVDYLTYASTTTATEKLQNACCTGTSYASNFTITSTPASNNFAPEITNKTRGTGVSLFGSTGWGTSTGYINHLQLNDYRSWKNNQLALAESPNGITGIVVNGGDFVCGSGSPCVSIVNLTKFFGTHFECNAFPDTNTMVELDGTTTVASRYIEMYGILAECGTSAGTRIFLNGFSSVLSRFMGNVVNLGIAYKFDASSGGNYIWGGNPGGTVGTQLIDASAGAEFFCTNAGCNGQRFQEGAAPSSNCGAGTDEMWGDSTAHRIKLCNNNSTQVTATTTVASGTSALGTGAISATTCATVVTTAATNTVSTDSISWAFNAAPGTAYTSGVHVLAYVTTGNVNFLVCNPTAGSLTPAAATLNWSVIR